MIHIGKLIQQKLEEKGESPVWLANQLHCSLSVVRRILENSSIETETLYRISSIIGYNFFQNYSQIVSQSIKA